MKASDRVGWDTNVLVFLDDPSHLNYLKARSLFEQVVKGQMKVCVSHQILSEYFSVITSGQRVQNPLTAPEAAERVLFLIKLRKIKKIYPKRSTLKRCIKFCEKNDIRGAKVFDVYYGINLLDNGVPKLVTQNIKDFAALRELGLEVENPF